jgi:hypothetical protein
MSFVHKVICDGNLLVKEVSAGLLEHNMIVGCNFMDWLLDLNMNCLWQNEINAFFTSVDNKLSDISSAIFLNQMVKIGNKNIPSILFYYLQVISFNDTYMILFHEKLPGKEFIVNVTDQATKKDNKVTFYYHRNVKSSTMHKVLNPFIYCTFISGLAAKDYTFLPDKIYANHFNLPASFRVKSLIRKELDTLYLELNDVIKLIPENVIPYTQLERPMIIDIKNLA